MTICQAVKVNGIKCNNDAKEKYGHRYCGVHKAQYEKEGKEMVEAELEDMKDDLRDKLTKMEDNIQAMHRIGSSFGERLDNVEQKMNVLQVKVKRYKEHQQMLKHITSFVEMIGHHALQFEHKGKEQRSNLINSKRQLVIAN